MNLFKFIGEIFGPAADLVDNIHTSTEEKLIQKAKLLETQVKFMEYALDYESKQLEAQASIVNAEAKSEHWVTATWRPITMLSFVAAVMAYWFGLTPDALPPEAVDNMFTLMQIGVGGYVVGRSAEKTIPAAMKALKSKEQT